MTGERQIRLHNKKVEGVLDMMGMKDVTLDYRQDQHQVIFCAEHGSSPGSFPAEKFVAWAPRKAALQIKHELERDRGGFFPFR